MNPSSFILTILVFVFSVSGKSQQFLPVQQKGHIVWENIRLLAWNEDTVNSYQFALAKKKFFYAIVRKDSSGKSEQYYSGTYRNSTDTLYLVYSHGKQPKELEPYLVKEVSGNYFIQYIAGSKMRLFLRQQNIGLKF